MTPDAVIQEILRLRDEAEKSQFEMPGTASLAWNHPGVLSYQIKTQPHYERDMREAKWLGDIEGLRLKMQEDGDGVAYSDAMDAFEKRAIPGLSAAIKRRDEIGSPYWQRGAFAYGQPLRAGTDWMQAFAATNMNAGRMIAGDEGAGDDFAESADRLFLGLPSALSGRTSEMQAAWEREREDAVKVPVGAIPLVNEGQSSIRILPKQESLPYEMQARAGLTQGSDFDLLSGDSLPAKAGAMAVDVITDPGSGIVDAIRSLLGKQLVRGASGAAAEFLVPGAMLASSEQMAADLRRKMEEERKRRGGY